MNLVLVPLKAELKALVSVLPEVQKNEWGYKHGNTQFVVGGLGKVQFAISTIKYAELLKPQKLFAFGSCGALKDHKPLSLVKLNKVVEHDFKSSFVPRPELLCASADDVDLPGVVCASGDQDVVSEGDKQKLLSQVDADVVTWESAGFFKAALELGLPFCEIRVVTDAANDHAAEDFKKNLQQGMQKLGRYYLS